jgi:hypothetical protein
MRQIILPYIFFLFFALIGCSGVIDEKQTERFFSDVGKTSITLFPTYIKRMASNKNGKPLGYDSANSGYSTIQAEQLSNFIQCECLAEVSLVTENVPLDKEWNLTQFGIWKKNLSAFSEYVKQNAIKTDYAAMAEYLIIHDRVWAVHTYVVDKLGVPVWGLHLNEHFAQFQQIQPHTPADATKVLHSFLQTGWPNTKSICSHSYKRSPQKPDQAGVIYNFESVLPSGKNRSGVPLGFSTFNDGKSKVTFSTIKPSPSLPNKSKENHVLTIEADIKSWGGVVDVFTNENNEQWISRNWSKVNGISLWLYGNNSGTELYVHVLDNRKSCSTYDDAGRYGYTFKDNFSGWKQIKIPFIDMKKSNAYNRALDDGFTLTNISGWAFGVTKTEQPVTYHIDDVSLF